MSLFAGFLSTVLQGVFLLCSSKRKILDAGDCFCCFVVFCCTFLETDQVFLPPQVWAGLRFMEGHWWWVNGADMRYTNLPVCPLLWEHCGALSKNDTVNMLNRECMERKNFLCYKIQTFYLYQSYVSTFQVAHSLKSWIKQLILKILRIVIRSGSKLQEY